MPCRPLPVPTFDEFVALHNVLQLALESQPDVLGQLRGARRSLGWNMLGNLLDMGQLAFAPASPDVYRCLCLSSRGLLCPYPLCDPLAPVPTNPLCPRSA